MRFPIARRVSTLALAFGAMPLAMSAQAAPVPRPIHREAPTTTLIRRHFTAGTRDYTRRPGRTSWQLPTAHRRTAIAAGLAAVALIAAGCGTSDDGTSVDGTAPATSVAGAPTTERATGSAAAQPTAVTIVGERAVQGTLPGPIAHKFSSPPPEQKQPPARPLPPGLLAAPSSTSPRSPRGRAAVSSR